MNPKTLLKQMIAFSFFSTNVFAQTNLVAGETDNSIAMQRSVQSSYREYKKYLSTSKRSDFASAYVEFNQTREINTDQIQSCLESLFSDNQNTTENSAENNSAITTVTICDNSLASLLAEPLNNQGKEIASSLIDRLLVSTKYQKSKNLANYSVLKKTIQGLHTKNKTRSLEFKAWHKLISEKIDLLDAHFLINGQEFFLNDLLNSTTDLDLSLIYQWSLITNTHEPIVVVGHFAQFAEHSLKNLIPFYGLTHEHRCPEGDQKEPKTFGLTKVSLFLSDQCILAKEKQDHEVHLGDLPPAPKLVPEHSNAWIWSAVVIVGVGLAVGLQNKKVSVSLPF